jgi:hypothetical protein
VKEDEMGSACSVQGKKRKAEGKRPLGRLRHRWVYNIRMDLREIGWGGINWIELT